MAKSLTRTSDRLKPSPALAAEQVVLSATARPPAADAPQTQPDPLLSLAAERVVIENVSPEIDGGRFRAKATVGDCFTVEADIYGDGHDKIDAALLIRRADAEGWTEAPMVFVDNDRWRGATVVEETWRPLEASPTEATGETDERPARVCRLVLSWS